MTSMTPGSMSPLALRYGAHRVLLPAGALPQAAERLYTEDLRETSIHSAGPSAIWDHELHLSVERLNVDSASFRQLEEEAKTSGEDPVEGVSRRVQRIVETRGKLVNPVTGSGGMLLGRVSHVGSALPEPHRSLMPGERVATLVSLSLTPLCLHGIDKVRLDTHQLDVRGQAVLFASGIFARIPEGLPEGVVLSALDVAGAAPQVSRLTKPGSRVLILGCGGKSGLLCSAAAKRAGARSVVGVENHRAARRDAEELGACDVVVSADATAPLDLAQEATKDGEFDLVVSCVNVPSAEMAAILCTKDRGVLYLFSMATSFTRAALGAEGVSKDIDMLIGNGYCHGHAEETLALLTSDQRLWSIFLRRFG